MLLFANPLLSSSITIIIRHQPALTPTLAPIGLVICYALANNRALLYLEGMEMSENSRRNMAIRKEIRRGELDNYFEERRRQLLQERSFEENSFQILFKSNEDREIFLEDCAKQLSGDPKPEWTTTVFRLRKTLNAFDGDFEQWFKKSVVSRLCVALEAQLPLALTGQVVELLIDMLYLAPEAAGIARNIMEYQPVHRVLTLAQCPRRTLDDRLRCTALLSRLVAQEPVLRGQMVRDGAGAVLVEQVREVVGNSDKLNLDNVILVVEASSNFLGMHRSCGFLPSNMNLVSTLLEPFMRLLMMEEVNDRALVHLIQCLTRILSSDREHIYLSVYETLGFPQRLFALLLSNQPSVRAQSVCLLASISYSSCQRITDDLIARGVISQLWESIRLFSTSSSALTKNVILALNNLMMSENNCEIICTSPLCAYVISQFTASENVEVQADAAYFINTAVQHLRYASLEAFLGRHDIIRLLAQFLIDLRCFDKRIAKEVLETLRILVDRSTEVFHANAHNPIIHTMERLYNVSVIAENYRETHSNKTLDALATALVTAIHNSYQENSEAVV